MSFQGAIAALNELINSKTVPGGDIPASVDSNGVDQRFNVQVLRRSLNLQRMSSYLKILDLDEPLSRLNVIHVAGTKGKGSTCAFSESILRSCGHRTGLFTSPHLVDICERFRLDGVEVSHDLFAKYFWWCWNRFQARAAAGESMPGFFPFLTLLALKMFTSENVDVAILEVGLGGRYDATNVVKAPAVCGITSLGFDHMEILGNTLADIASEKAGIFKAGVPAFSVPQEPEAMDVLQKEARRLAIPFKVAPSLESYGVDLHLGLEGDHQRMNAALSVILCAEWEKRCGSSEHWTMVEQRELPGPYSQGLADTFWPGRGQLIYDKTLENIPNGSVNGKILPSSEESGTLAFYLDGAHSPESMEACAKWFCNATQSEIKKIEDSVSGYTALKRLYEQNHSRCWFESQATAKKCFIRRVLLFNCMPKRDPELLLPPLINICAQKGIPFHMALFVPPFSSIKSIDTRSLSDITASLMEAAPDMSWQKTLQRSWESLLQTRSAVLQQGGVANGFVSGSLCLENNNNMDPAPELVGTRYTIEGDHGPGYHLGSSSAVMPSLPAAVNWLRQCRRGNPKVHIQVLVTGSLYLVGDLLKILTY